MVRNNKCSACGRGLVARPKEGETRSNKESSIVYHCPNYPHEPAGSSDESVDMDGLREIAEKHDL
jgi:hypothetical protein